jgi:hypothetical protein
MLTDHMVLLSGALLLCLFFLHHIQWVNKARKALRNTPAYSLLVSPTAGIARILPRIQWVSGGPDFRWRNVYECQALSKVRFYCPAHGMHAGVFATSKSDIVQIRSLFPYGIPQLLLADATAIKVTSLLS